MTDEPGWFEQILDLQLERNHEQLAELRRQGVDDGPCAFDGWSAQALED